MALNQNIPPLLREAIEGHYIRSVLEKHAPKPLAFLIARNRIDPIVKAWAHQYLKGINASGSFAKGTAVDLSHDVDLFISLGQDAPGSLKDIYESLYSKLTYEGLTPVRQNVSIGVNVAGVSVDLIPARRIANSITAHALYRRKRDSWTKTNIAEHIRIVKQSQRVDEIKALKLWRWRFNLDFPSFYLEMAVIDALKGSLVGYLGRNFRTAMTYLATEFMQRVFVDPANSNNVVSDDLTMAEKRSIANAATTSIGLSIHEVLP